MTTLVVSSALSPTAAPLRLDASMPAAEATAEASPAPWLLPAQMPLDAAANAPAHTQGGDQVLSAVAFDPRVALPEWVRTTRDTSLWAGSDMGSNAVGSLTAGSAYLRPLGPFDAGRIEVYFPGDGDSAPPAQAWIDVGAVAPSGVWPWVATPAASPSSLPAPPRQVGDTAPPNVTALHVAVIDEASGQMLYGEQPHTAVPQASTTKIATTIVALERSPDVSRRITVSVSASAMAARDGSSTMGIEPGELVTLDTLLHGMMLPSGNDAAEQVAVALADSRARYVQWMNQDAAALGLKDTHFANPSGMDAPGHYSSAYDMAMLARYAMRNPAFRDLAASSHYVGDHYSLQNLNRLLDIYPGADGVKIGYTDAALKTIVASATHDGHRVYISLMHSKDLVGDCSQLFDWVWENFQY